MNETEREQIKCALLKCAEENENKPTFTGYVVVSSVCKSAVERIEELEQENAELKEQLQKKINTTTVSDYPYSALKLEEAKDLLDKVLRVVHSELHPYQMQPYLEVLKQAEQFLKELETNEDRLCEYCDQYESYPDGKCCRTCDDGSKWKRRTDK